MNMIFEKYNGQSLQNYVGFFGEGSDIDYYKTFLIQTDYIVIKISEGASTKEDYSEELEAREYARSEIRRLEMM